MKKVDYDIFNSNIKENARDLGGLMFNGALGYVESLCSPLALLRIFREADSEFEKDRVSVYNLACHGFEALLYTAGVISHIERLVNDPSDWKSWIPVATNALGRTAGYIYNNHER
ncbi:MAG TPA: hypothetical protein VHA12_00950, partial [Candidatus Nanoarchaeia archaeon]|nr:hypothetical protein [Candidatus Nanoarchaeia archaeon]